MDKSEELKQEFIYYYAPRIITHADGIPMPDDHFIKGLNDFLSEYVQQINK